MTLTLHNTYVLQRVETNLLYDNSLSDVEKTNFLSAVIYELNNQDHTKDALNKADIKGYFNDAADVINDVPCIIQWINETMVIYYSDILTDGTLQEIYKYLEYDKGINNHLITADELERLEYNPNIVVINNGLSGRYYNTLWYTAYENDPDNGRDYEYYINLDLENFLEVEQIDLYCLD